MCDGPHNRARESTSCGYRLQIEHITVNYGMNFYSKIYSNLNSMIILYELRCVQFDENIRSKPLTKMKIHYIVHELSSRLFAGRPQT